MEEKDCKLIIDKLVEEYGESIKGEEFEQELKQGLETYLYEFKKSIEKFGVDSSVEDALRFSVQKIKKLPINHQKQKLIIDEKYYEIQKNSMEAFELANKRLKGNKDEIEETKLTKIKETLKNNLSQVKEFNKDMAENLVSEGLLDITFLESSKINTISSRLGKLITQKNN